PGFLLSACAEAPLKAGNIADIVTEIKAAQKRHVRESSGTQAYECFTDLDYQEFKAGKVRRKSPERCARIGNSWKGCLPFKRSRRRSVPRSLNPAGARCGLRGRSWVGFHPRARPRPGTPQNSTLPMPS